MLDILLTVVAILAGGACVATGRHCAVVGPWRWIGMNAVEHWYAARNLQASSVSVGADSCRGIALVAALAWPEPPPSILLRPVRWYRG